LVRIQDTALIQQVKTPISVRHSLEAQVRLALSLREHGPDGIDRRKEKRNPYPYPVQLTPVDDSGNVQAKTFSVVGKYLSNCELEFYYHQPVPYRRVIASLQRPDRNWLGLLMELSSCRFNQHGWYENGGRFLRPIESPLMLTSIIPSAQADSLETSSALHN